MDWLMNVLASVAEASHSSSLEPGIGLEPQALVLAVQGWKTTQPRALKPPGTQQVWPPLACYLVWLEWQELITEANKQM